MKQILIILSLISLLLVSGCQSTNIPTETDCVHTCLRQTTYFDHSCVGGCIGDREAIQMCNTKCLDTKPSIYVLKTVDNFKLSNTDFFCYDDNGEVDSFKIEALIDSSNPIKRHYETSTLIEDVVMPSVELREIYPSNLSYTKRFDCRYFASATYTINSQNLSYSDRCELYNLPRCRPDECAYQATQQIKQCLDNIR